MRRSIHSIILIFASVSIILTAFSYLQSQVMDSVRAYVRGEGLYAKAQKEATYELFRYLESGESSTFLQFQKNLEIPIGDRLAREALQLPAPDLAIAYRGFAQAQNHPADINGMIWFFQYFQNFPYVSEAVVIWEKADRLITELQTVGIQIQRAKADHDSEKVAQLSLRVHELHEELAVLETRFSLVLSEGSRWVKSVLFWASIVVLLVMLAFASLITRRILKEIELRESERLQNELAIKQSEERFTLAMRAANDGLWDWNMQTDVVYFSPRWKSMLGYEDYEMENNFLAWEKLVDEAGHNKTMREIESCIAGRQDGFVVEFKMRHKNGEWIDVLSHATIIRDDFGKPRRMVGTHKDITAQKRAEEELRLAAKIFTASSEGMMVVEANNRIASVNPAFTMITGFDARDVIGQDPKILTSGRQNQLFYQDLWEALNTTGVWQGELWNRRRNGELFAIHQTINTIYDDEGVVHRRVALFTDVTEKKKSEEIIWQQANFDALTGLLNRRMFLDRMERQLAAARRAKESFALLFIDLDHFKEVNDTLGHQAGDELIIMAAQRLLACVRESDTVARLGGDEFTVILPRLNEVSDIDGLLRNIIAKLAEPYLLGSDVARVSASIGVTLFPNDGAELDQLLQNADQAMYTAKKKGRNCFSYFNLSSPEGNV